MPNDNNDVDPGPSLITVRDLIKVYKNGKLEVIALRGVDMDVEKGEIVAIMGPSGCGKTTLLNILAGLDQPTAGSVRVEGESISEMDESQLVRYRRNVVGVIFQFFNLSSSLTARENVELPIQAAGKPAEYIQKTTEQLLEAVDMADREHHRPDELSGGEQQRIAIAAALTNNPPIILADEPTG